MHGGTAEAPVFELARLIHPIEPEKFKQEYWEKKPLVIARQDRHYYRSLLSLADLDQILSTSGIRSPNVRLLRSGEEIPFSNFAAHGHARAIEALYEKYRDGCTIAIQFLHERSRPLMEMCQSLAGEFSATLQSNAYLTPPNETGLDIHYDTHDVFVLQTEGVKHWRLFEQSIRLPLRGQPCRKEKMNLGDPLAEFDLHAGDAIYIPRGYGHHASALGSTSLHITVGIHPVTWASVMLGAMEAAIEHDARFRESLPVGFAQDKRKREMAEGRLMELLDAFREHVRPELAIDNAVELALTGRPPSLEHHLLDLEAAHNVSADTRLRRRPKTYWRLTTEDERASLHFHGKVVRMPSFLERDVHFMATVDEFRAGDLPGDLDDEGRTILIRRLLREGFLTICR